MSSMLRWVDIDEQVMNEAILSPHPSQLRRSRPEESGADSEYADVVAELRQLRAASQLSRYRGVAPRLPSREATLSGTLFPRSTPATSGLRDWTRETPMLLWLGRLR